MKSLAVFFAGISFLLLTVPLMAFQEELPIIFNHNETAASGEVFGMQGAGFGINPQVWFAVVSGSEKSLIPAGQLEVVSASDRNISALLPADSTVKKGSLVAVWVKNGGKLSKPFFLNRARIVTIEYQEIMPGQHFRIFGRNLGGQVNQPEVRFAEANGQRSFLAKVISTEPFVMRIAAPAEVKKNTRYKIYVSNGAGGKWGESVADELILGRATAPDPFGLKVPWGTEFSFANTVYNVKTDERLSVKAKGDGLTDDRVAIQQAIDLAHQQGGGVVYLPSGNYKLDIPSGSGLVMKSRVVLKGDGPEKTNIQYGFGTPPPYPEPIGKGGWPDATTEGVAVLWPLNTTLSGLYNLRLENVNTSGKWRHSLKTMEPPFKKPGASGSMFFASNCRFDFAVAWGLSWGYVDRFVVADCTFESRAQVTWPWLWHCNGSTNFVVRNNRVRYAAGRFGFNDSYNGIIENNHITRLGDLQPVKGETGGFNIDYASDIIVLGNRMDVEGREIENHNQGETILSQGGNPEHQTAGYVSGATSTSLTDATQKWGSVRTASLGSSDAVAIVKGKGTGQWRQIISNNSTTLRLDRPWDIIPDKSSHYVVMRWSAEDWLVKDNVLEGNNRGIWFYCGNTDVVITGNKLTDSEGIYLRADQRIAAGRYNLSWNTLVTDNQVINRKGLRPAFICNTLVLVASDSLHGTGSLGIEIRRNYVEAHEPNSATFVRGEGYFNEVNARTEVKGNTIGILGTIFEQNKTINAEIGYRLYKAINQTVIKEPIYRNVKTPVTEAKGTVILDDKRMSTDPFKSYLDGKGPRILKDLGEEMQDGVKVRRLQFYSREVKTASGAVPTEVFAAIIRPVLPGNYPGLLVLHGGGGAAEVDRGIRWAKQGYVVVTLDLPGIAEPTKVPQSAGNWKTFPYGKQRFTTTPDITSSTIFDAVLAALQGLYLLHDQPDVNKDRIGITGVSWGGYMTTMLSGLAAPYVRASFSTYGSGFYDTNSTFLKELDKMPAVDRETWITWLDAGRRAKNIASPFFIAAATNDNWFYPPAVLTTLNAINSPTSHFFAPNASHSAPIPGGNGSPDRIGYMQMEELYFNFYLKDSGLPLPEISIGEMTDSKVQPGTDNLLRFFVNSKTPITESTIYYSTVDALWTKRKWIALKVLPNEKTGWYEAELPSGIRAKGTYWFASVSDSRPVTVSSKMIECK